LKDEANPDQTHLSASRRIAGATKPIRTIAVAVGANENLTGNSNVRATTKTSHDAHTVKYTLVSPRFQFMGDIPVDV